MRWFPPTGGTWCTARPKAQARASGCGEVKTDSNVNIVPSAPVIYLGLAFSRDGDYVYYVARDPQSPIASLYQIPVLGGAPRRVLDDIDSNPTFSPDGTRLAFMRGYPAEHSTSVVIANLDGSGERRADHRGVARLFHDQPRRASRPVVVARRTGDRHADGEQSWDARRRSSTWPTGSIRKLGTKTWYTVRRVGWLADSSTVLAAVAENSAAYLQHQGVGVPGVWRCAP